MDPIQRGHLMTDYSSPSVPPWRQKKGKGRSPQSLVLGSQKFTVQSFPACANFLPGVPSYKVPDADSGQGVGREWPGPK